MIMNKLNFKSRIMFATISVVLLAVVLIGALIYWHVTEASKQTLLARIAIEAEIISQNMVTPILFDDSTAASEILITAKSDPAILLAEVKNEFGEKFAMFKSDRTEENPFYYEQDIQFNGDTIGRLFFLVSKDEVYEKNYEILGFLGVVSIVVILMALLLLMPMIRSLLLPLFNLYDVSEEITKTRNYRLRVKVKTQDEIGQLSTMFNAMLEQVENRDDMLEKQVGQRTEELERLAEEFRFRAFHDALTGLPNRALLNERFELSMQHARRAGGKFACLLLDLDEFKTINDTKGHEFGDDLLVEVATRLKGTVRGEDLVCRLGGDEFIFVLNDLKSTDDAKVVAKKILTNIQRPFEIQGETIKTSASVGGAIYPDHGIDISTIKRHADVAMYRAKDAGKNRFCLFSQGMQEDVKFKLLVQNDLLSGIANQQLEIYLQPKVDARYHTLIGCEALVRWHHPQEGFLAPDKFIPYAEELGLVMEVDYFVLRQSCATIVTWNKDIATPLQVAINLSGRHFHDFKIVEVLKSAIESYDVNPALLEIEITEAVLIDDPDKAKEVVQAIKKLGVEISLDDFGTGYSSLNYLRTLPIGTVKLDQSFISNINSNDQDRRLVSGIVSLAQGLGLKIVAEGVETEAQLTELLKLGCHAMQGYYFLGPVTYTEFVGWYQAEFEASSKRKAKLT